jgi:Sensors of blue-light using FAD
MTTDLYRLIYFSRNLIPGTPDAIAGDIDAILAISQRNNSRVGVTGALIFNSGIFAQVLEGPRSEIEATFERIQRDERHGDVQVLAFDKVQSRGFPSWSMAFVGRSRDGQALFERIGVASGFEARRLEGERIFSIMRDIAIDEEKRVA